MVDISVVIELASYIVKSAVPIGIVFLLIERLVIMFIKFAFGKSWGGV